MSNRLAVSLLEQFLFRWGFDCYFCLDSFCFSLLETSARMLEFHNKISSNTFSFHIPFSLKYFTGFSPFSYLPLLSSSCKTPSAKHFLNPAELGRAEDPRRILRSDLQSTCSLVMSTQEMAVWWLQNMSKPTKSRYTLLLG